MPVRFEDEYLLVVAKPAGVVTHPTERRRSGTLVNRLLFMGVPLSTTAVRSGRGSCIALDVGTSARLMLVAKTDEAHDALARCSAATTWSDGDLALVRGRVEHEAFAVDAAPRKARRARDPGCDPGRAETRFEVLERPGSATLLRRRRDRPHPSDPGAPVLDSATPILGDRVYGGRGTTPAAWASRGRSCTRGGSRSPSDHGCADSNAEEPLPGGPGIGVTAGGVDAERRRRGPSRPEARRPREPGRTLRLPRNDLHSPAGRKPCCRGRPAQHTTSGRFVHLHVHSEYSLLERGAEFYPTRRPSSRRLHATACPRGRHGSRGASASGALPASRRSSASRPTSHGCTVRAEPRRERGEVSPPHAPGGDGDGDLLCRPPTWRAWPPAP